MSHRSAYLWLRIVEFTAIPLIIFMALYMLSGYGMLYPQLTRLIGFSYRLSVYIHTSPILRYLISLFVALHGCGGIVLLARRYVSNAALRNVIQVLGIAYAAVVIAIPTIVEILVYLR